jgi:hypothetical protein
MFDQSDYWHCTLSLTALKLACQHNQSQLTYTNSQFWQQSHPGLAKLNLVQTVAYT